MRRRTYRALCALTVAATGCGGGDGNSVKADASVDASDIDAAMWNGGCWPVETSTPGGAMTLGSGSDSFQPMPAELQLQYGGQDGFNLVVNIKQMGFGTGDPDNILNVTNPRTRVRAFFDDTNVPLITGGPCPYRMAYDDVGNGEYVLGDPLPVIFDICWRSGNLIGKQIRLEGELLDWNGMTYAHDTRVVTAVAPPVGYPDEPDAPGCPQ